MKICIYGAGAGGGHFAVKLAKAGHDVSVIARGVHLSAIRQSGLCLRSGQQLIQADVRAAADPRDLGVQDLVIVTVKATALSNVASDLGVLVDDSTIVIFPQNGMTWWYPHGLSQRCPPPPDIAIFSLATRFFERMRADQVLGGIVYSANEIEGPGIIRNNSPDYNRLDLGQIAGPEPPALSKIRQIFEGSGVLSPRIDSIRYAVWSKLIANISGSGIALVTRSKSAACREDANLCEIFRRLVCEAVAVATAHGFPVNADPELMLSRLADHKPSLLQDYEQGRPMEVDEIILAPVAFARACSLATPTLDVIAAIAAKMAAERGHSPN